MIKKFILEATDDPNKEHTSLRSNNDGFNALELLGILELKRIDLIKQINGEIKPAIVKRELVED